MEQKKRYGLAPYVGEYVLCKGWIKGWKDISKTSQRRVVISQPTIKKPNKNLLFANQEILSKEHHLNLFINKDILYSYEIYEDFQIYNQFCFAGVVKEYQRKNGTIDYGIYPTAQSTLHYRLSYITHKCLELTREDRYSSNTLEFMNFMLPQLDKMIEELEIAGDYLPTFYSTYNKYKIGLDEWREGVEDMISKIQNIHNSRAYRRGKYKVKKRNDGQRKQQLITPFLS